MNRPDAISRGQRYVNDPDMIESALQSDAVVEGLRRDIEYPPVVTGPQGLDGSGYTPRRGNPLRIVGFFLVLGCVAIVVAAAAYLIGGSNA